MKQDAEKSARMPRQTSYPSDLTDAQWKLIEPHIPPEKWGGRTRDVVMRDVIDGLLYLNRTGCPFDYAQGGGTSPRTSRTGTRAGTTTTGSATTGRGSGSTTSP